MITKSLDPHTVAKTHEMGVFIETAETLNKPYTTPATFTAHQRWSNSHIVSADVINKRLVSFTHYRDNKFSSCTEFDENKNIKRAIRNVFGHQVDVTGLFKIMAKVAPSLILPHATPVT